VVRVVRASDASDASDVSDVRDATAARCGAVRRSILRSLRDLVALVRARAYREGTLKLSGRREGLSG
jgi:hypothetical protein